MMNDATGLAAEKIGGFLVTIGALQSWQVKDVVLAQRQGDRRLFGEIAISRGYVDDAALQQWVDAHAAEAAIQASS